jgi:hypothetical protein
MLLLSLQKHCVAARVVVTSDYYGCLIPWILGSTGAKFSSQKAAERFLSKQTNRNATQSQAHIQDGLYTLKQYESNA